MSRLILISNKSHAADASFAGTQTSVLQEIITRRTGLWLSWNGEVHDVDETAFRPVTRTRQPGFEQITFPLSPMELQHFYEGYAHDGIWPVFHNRPDLAHFSDKNFYYYLHVNNYFADIAAKHICREDIIWVHDYHLIGCGRALREKGLPNRTGFFLHIPFPSSTMMKTIPEHKWLVESLFFYDLIGFQSAEDLNNFIHYLSVEYRIERLSSNLLRVNGHIFTVAIFPSGININDVADNLSQTGRRETPARRHVTGPQNLIISADRLDETTGLPHQVDAMRYLLAHHPEYRLKATLLQIAAPPRAHARPMDALAKTMDNICGEVNGAYGDLSWLPVQCLHAEIKRSALFGLYRAARVALVTPLCSGMNFNAKEYIACQDPGDPGVLILSTFTGAARQLKDAIMVNPYNIQETGEAIHLALTLPLRERKKRFQRLYHSIRQYDSRWWSDTFIALLEQSGTTSLSGPLPFYPFQNQYIAAGMRY